MQLDAARIMLADIAMRDNRSKPKAYLDACKPITRMEEEFQRVATCIAAAEDRALTETAALKARIDRDVDDRVTILPPSATLGPVMNPPSRALLKFHRARPAVERASCPQTHGRIFFARQVARTGTPVSAGTGDGAQQETLNKS